MLRDNEAFNLMRMVDIAIQCYNMETGQITICLTAPDDTAGIIAGFMEVEKRHWLDDMAS